MANFIRSATRSAPNILRSCIRSQSQCFQTKQLITSNHNVQSVTRSFSATRPAFKKETVTVYFVAPNGNKLEAQANVGDNLLDVVIENDVDIDGFGACEGTLACSTCHLIFKQENYDKLPDEPTDEELDMLDLAYGLCDTSRLGCQVIVTKDMDKMEVSVPAGLADARS